MAWTTPKTDWTTADGVDFNDLNRIEDNIDFIADNPTGTALQLAPSGGNVLIGTTVDSTRLVVADGVGSLPTISGNTVALFQNNSAVSSGTYVSIIGGADSICHMTQVNCQGTFNIIT